MDLRHLFASQTIAELAPWVSHAEANASAVELSPLVALAGNGTRPPLFCVHPSDGSVECYLGLAHKLRDVPVYGLRAVDRDEQELSIPALALQYADMLTSFLPQGPFQLFGMSMGGALAYEIARQLHARGRQVSLLGLLDLALRDLHETPEDPIDAAIRYHPRFAGPLAALKQSPSQDRLSTFMATAVQAGMAPTQLQVADVAPFLERSRRYLRAMRAYRPGRYSGDVLVLAGERAELVERDWMHWQTLVTGKVALAHLPAAHFDLLREPAVERLAALLEPTLARTVDVVVTGEAAR